MGRYLEIARETASKPVSVAQECADIAYREKSELSEKSLLLNDSIAEPIGPYPDCGGGQWWQLPGEPWHCRACEPDMPLRATSLTLPCHQSQARPVRAHGYAARWKPQARD
jgi:hypothetical protein